MSSYRPISLLRELGVYGYYVSDDQTKIYPFTRNYTSIGQLKGVWCMPPQDASLEGDYIKVGEEYTDKISRIYLYNDSDSPWSSEKNRKLYESNKSFIEQSYTRVEWGTHPNIRGFMFNEMLVFQCPFCHTRYKKNGEPTQNSKPRWHCHETEETWFREGDRSLVGEIVDIETRCDDPVLCLNVNHFKLQILPIPKNLSHKIDTKRITKCLEKGGMIEGYENPERR